MQAIPISAVLKFKADIQAQLANAVAALRVADTKLGKTLHEYTGTDAYHEKDDLMEARYNARFFADMLDESDTPSLPSRVFRAIASYANRDSRNTSHMEGAIIALTLAERCLTCALELALQFDGDDIDEAYQQPFAARATIRAYASVLGCTAMVFDHEKALKSVMSAATKRTSPIKRLAMAA